MRANPWSALIVITLMLLAVRTASAQAEIDRLLVKVNGAVLMSSDIRQARALKLVADISSDAAVERALENRLLMVAEVNRLSTPPAADDQVADRRRQWQSSVGGEADALLQRHGMSAGALDAWFRDDLRVDSYVKQTFGDQSDPAKARAAAAWVDRLRARAGLR
jgi:hypothetical protein